MRNNKGFSLVELIVVIAIMAVMVGASVITVGMIGGFKAKECAQSIETTLNKARVDTMGKFSVYLKFYQGADGAFYVDTYTNGAFGSTERVGKKGVTVSYADENDLSNLRALDSTGFYVQFDRSSGALRSPEVGATARVEKIVVTQGSKTITITIYPETGKVVSE